MSVFGEVELGMSRAVSDDEDDEYSQKEEDETLKRKIYWLNNSDSNKIICDELILADGPNSSAFIYTYLLSHLKSNEFKLIGLSATLHEFNVFKINHENGENNSTSLNSKYKSNFINVINKANGKQMVVCQLNDHLKSNELYDWMNQLTEKIEFSNLLVFCSQDKSHFLGSKVEGLSFCRYVSSDKETTNDIGCSRLEEPNFISDLPAAAIHYCVAKNKPFLAFICYTTLLNVDMSSVKEMFNAVSKKLKEKNLFIENESTRKTLLSINNITSSASNLYM